MIEYSLSDTGILRTSQSVFFLEVILEGVTPASYMEHTCILFPFMTVRSTVF
jgi:hypothetical protein